MGILKRVKAFFSPDFDEPIPDIRGIQTRLAREEKLAELRHTIASRRQHLSERSQLRRQLDSISDTLSPEPR